MSSKKAVVSASERALKYVERTNRIKLQDLRDNPGARSKSRQIHAWMNQAGHTRGELQHAAKPPLGWIWGDFFRPWHRMFPGEKHFNGDINLRREYPPISLLELQRLIDLGWLNTENLIDLTALCNTKRFRCQPSLRQFGVQLTDEGAERFTSCVNLEVQWASETAIAAVERVGGRIRTAYYDIGSLQAAVDPREWFLSGQPIPRRKAPPESLLSYYTNPRNRGYLARDEEIEAEEHNLAQLMGYTRPKKQADKQWERKRPDQLFVGLESGSLVSLTDRKVFLPTNPVLQQYYGIGCGESESSTELLLSDHAY